MSNHGKERSDESIIRTQQEHLFMLRCIKELLGFLIEQLEMENEPNDRPDNG